jgi:hypothetical protein
VLAQFPEGEEPQSRIEQDLANNQVRLIWQSYSGWTYFIQHSEDLQDWTYLNVIEPGNGSEKEWAYQLPLGDKFFLRLHATTATGDPFTGDFDGDGLSNQDEVAQALNPLNEDTDWDGILDGVDPNPSAPNVAPTFGVIQERIFSLGSFFDVPVIATDGDGDLERLVIEGAGFDLESDFLSLPDGAALFGSAQVVGGELQLTSAAQNQYGTMMVPGVAWDEDFRVSFDLFIGGGAGGNGFVFAFGALADGLINESFVAEDTISIQFDTYTNNWERGYDDNANTVEVWFGSVRLGKAVTTLRTATAVPVEILREGDTLTIRHNGVTLFDKLSIPPIPEMATTRFGFGAGCGAFTDRHAMDNLEIEGSLASAQWVESGHSETLINPVSGSAQRILRIFPGKAGGGRMALMAEDSLGLEGRYEFPFAVVAPVQTPGDSDGDGLSDAQEALLGTASGEVDTNHDGLWDGASVSAGIDPLALDSDGDGVLNTEELLAGTNPFKPDTDRDGTPDDEDAYPLDPLRHEPLGVTPGDTTAPVLTLVEPAEATLLP